MNLILVFLAFANCIDINKILKLQVGRAFYQYKTKSNHGALDSQEKRDQLRNALRNRLNNIKKFSNRKLKKLKNNYDFLQSRKRINS